MLRIRIVSIAAAATAVAAIVAANGAAAQTASAAQSGQPPLSLVQPGKQTTTAHDDGAGKTRIKKTASRKHHEAAAAKNPDPDPAQNAASADAWLAASATPANSAMPAAETAPAAQPGNAPPDMPSNNAQAVQSANPQTGNADDKSLPSAVVVGGQTVQIAKSDEVNAIDLAADDAPAMESAAQPGDRADTAARAKQALQAAFAAQPPANASQGTAAQNMNLDASQNGGPAARLDASQISSQDASQASIQDANQDTNQNTSTIGSASWIAQVLAALGGAITAGVLAWFLIGAGPVRSYG